MENVKLIDWDSLTRLRETSKQLLMGETTPAHLQAQSSAVNAEQRVVTNVIRICNLQGTPVPSRMLDDLR